MQSLTSIPLPLVVWESVMRKWNERMKCDAEAFWNGWSTTNFLDRLQTFWIGYPTSGGANERYAKSGTSPCPTWNELNPRSSSSLQSFKWEVSLLSFQYISQRSILVFYYVCIKGVIFSLDKKNLKIRGYKKQKNVFATCLHNEKKRNDILSVDVVLVLNIFFLSRIIFSWRKWKMA